jgi:hypothetical protein
LLLLLEEKGYDWVRNEEVNFDFIEERKMSIITENISLKDEFLNLYRDNAGMKFKNSAPLMNVHREDALPFSGSWGFPAKGNEDYRYADIESVFNKASKNVLENRKSILKFGKFSIVMFPIWIPSLTFAC